MKLSISTNAFIRFSLEESLSKIARIGYMGVEILADTPHLFAPAFSQDGLERIKRCLSLFNLQVASLNANTAVGYYINPPPEQLFGPSLADREENLRQWRIEYTKRCIDIAVVLNCPSVSITSGKPQAGLLPEKAYSKLIMSLQEILRYAQSKEISLAIEYEPGLLVESYQEVRDLLNLINNPYFGVNLDLGHAWVQREDPVEVIEKLEKAILHIHLEDIKGRKHYHLIPGEGDLDFQKILAKLTQVGYTGYLSLELYTYPDCPEEAAEKAFHYVAPFFLTGGFSKSS